MKNPGIYILTSPSGKQYVGKDHNLPSRVRAHLSGNTPLCPAIHNAIQKYGHDTFSVEIIRYPGISHETLDAVERWKIRQLQTLAPKGYNLTDGGDSGKPSEETRQKMSKSVSKRVEDGTHHFLDGEVQRRTQKKLVEEGTHRFLGGEIPRCAQKKLVEEGKHHFLDGEVSRLSNKKRLEDGTHHFLGTRNPVHKRIANGTHHFLGDKNPAKRLSKEGKHHLLGENNPIKRLAKDGRHPRTLKRLKGEWCYIIAVSRFYYEIHEYTLKRRAEFLSKDIPDLSNAEQTTLF